MEYEDLLISLSDVSPKEALNIIIHNPNHKHKSGYKLIIKKDPYRAYIYALFVIKGRFPEAEEYIKKDPRYAYLYAKNVMNDENFWDNN